MSNSKIVKLLENCWPHIKNVSLVLSVIISFFSIKAILQPMYWPVPRYSVSMSDPGTWDHGDKILNVSNSGDSVNGNTKITASFFLQIFNNDISHPDKISGKYMTMPLREFDRSFIYTGNTVGRLGFVKYLGKNSDLRPYQPYIQDNEYHIKSVTKRLSSTPVKSQKMAIVAYVKIENLNTTKCQYFRVQDGETASKQITADSYAENNVANLGGKSGGIKVVDGENITDPNTGLKDDGLPKISVSNKKGGFYTRVREYLIRTDQYVEDLH